MRYRTGRVLLVAMLALAFLSLPAGAVKLVIWDYVAWRVDYYQQYADEYMRLHPDVEIEVQLIPQSEYVNKIVIGTVTGTAPAAFAAHPAWVSSFAGLLEPFPHDLFPPGEMSWELLGYSELLQDGYAYYYPLGVQGPVLWINQDIWEQAGIAEPPRTWDEAVDIGRRTSRVVDGVTQIAGFYFTDDMMINVFVDLNYQLGGTMYRDGGRRVAFDEPPARDAVRMLADWYGMGVSGTGGEVLNFHNGQNGMRYGYAWYQQVLRTQPDLRWTVAAIPTMTGALHPGMSRMDYYFGLAVPVGNGPEVARAAFEFIHWAYSDDQRLIDLNSQSGTLPARYSVWGEPEIMENPVLRLLTETLPLTVIPGEFPEWIKTELNKVRSVITRGTADPVVALHEVTRVINARLATEPITWLSE